MQPVCAATLVERLHPKGLLPIDPYVVAAGQGVAVRLNLSPNARDGYHHHARSLNIAAGSSPLRQRFAVAHGLWYALVGLDYTASRGSYRMDPDQPLDVLANQFAMQLLMPAAYVEAVVVKRGETGLTTIARMFGVSSVLAAARLKQLGYL